PENDVNHGHDARSKDGQQGRNYTEPYRIPVEIMGNARTDTAELFIIRIAEQPAGCFRSRGLGRRIRWRAFPGILGGLLEVTYTPDLRDNRFHVPKHDHLPAPFFQKL